MMLPAWFVSMEICTVRLVSVRMCNLDGRHKALDNSKPFKLFSMDCIKSFEPIKRFVYFYSAKPKSLL
jgi:hypothetical protein